MRVAALFRKAYLVVPVIFSLGGLSGSAEALWLEVTRTEPLPSPPLIVRIDDAPRPGPSPAYGLSPVAPSPFRDPALAPRLRMQYRAAFPAAVMLETDGALAGERLGPSGALNLSGRVIIDHVWWTPQVTTSLADLRMDSLTEGRLLYGEATIKGEWRLRF